MFVIEILFALWMFFASGDAVGTDGTPPFAPNTATCGDAGGALDPDGNCAP